MGSVSLANWVMSTARGCGSTARRRAERGAGEDSKWRGAVAATQQRRAGRAVSRRAKSGRSRALWHNDFGRWSAPAERGSCQYFLASEFGRFAELNCAFPREENHEETEQGGVALRIRRSRMLRSPVVSRRPVRQLGAAADGTALEERHQRTAAGATASGRPPPRMQGCDGVPPPPAPPAPAPAPPPAPRPLRRRRPAARRRRRRRPRRARR